METDEQSAEPDVAPSATPAPQGRRRGAGLALAAAAALVTGVAGFAAGRTTAPEPAPAPSPPPVSLPGVGPTRMEGGVPLGYARSREGAAAAAVNFAGVLTSQRLVDRKAYTDAVALITAPESRQAELKKANDYLDVLENGFHLLARAQLGFSVAIRYAPFGHLVTALDQDTATVKVWGSTVFGIEQEEVPVELWSTTTYRLRFLDGDWRMVEQRQETSTAVPKALQQVPASTRNGLPAELGGFQQTLLYELSRQQ